MNNCTPRYVLLTVTVCTRLLLPDKSSREQYAIKALEETD